jgi:uncharacterized small protein (DUF1192 family)
MTKKIAALSREIKRLEATLEKLEITHNATGSTR